MQQYFVSENLRTGDLYDFNVEQNHHVVNVMRMKEGNIVRLVDPRSIAFSAAISYSGNKAFAMVLEELKEDHELPVRVTLLMALIKNDKWDMMLQKATELGVSRIVPFESSRTVVKVSSNIDKKLIRWNKIVQEASEQCKRTVIPEIMSPVKFRKLKDYSSELNFVAYEDLGNPREFSGEIRKGKDISMVIGPEGGFSEQEIAYLNESGFVSVRLGKRILRAETAAMYTLSCVSAVLENEEV